MALVALSTAVPVQYVRVGNRLYVIPDGNTMPGFGTRFQRDFQDDIDDDRLKFDGPRFQEVSLDEKTDVVGVPVNFPHPSMRSTRRPTRTPTRKTTPKPTQSPSASGVKYVRIGDKVYIIRENQDEGRFEELGSDDSKQSPKNRYTTTAKPTQKPAPSTTTTEPVQSAESTNQKSTSFTSKIKKMFSWFSS